MTPRSGNSIFQVSLNLQLSNFRLSFPSLIAGMMLLFSLTNGSNSQSIDITNFNNPGLGIHVIQSEKIDLIESHHNVIHTVNVTEYRKAFNQIKASAMDIPGTIPLYIERELRRIEGELNLFHSARPKRGLLNIIGSGIKFITGNMDNEDAELIKDQLNTIKMNQKNFITNSNKQNHFSDIINNELKAITNHINMETQLYAKGTENISHAIEDLQMELRKKIASDGIITALKILHDHIVDIRQSISFAKTGMLSAHLLEIKELTNLTIWQYENIQNC